MFPGLLYFASNIRENDGRRAADGVDQMICLARIGSDADVELAP